MDLYTLLANLPDRYKLGFANSHVAVTYVAEVTLICVTSTHKS